VTCNNAGQTDNEEASQLLQTRKIAQAARRTRASTAQLCEPYNNPQQTLKARHNGDALHKR